MRSDEGPVIMSGRKLADEMQAMLTKETAEMREQGITPGLATILVGDDGPSATYIAMKHRACEEIGIRSIHTHLPASTSQEELLQTIGGNVAYMGPAGSGFLPGASIRTRAFSSFPSGMGLGVGVDRSSLLFLSEALDFG